MQDRFKFRAWDTQDKEYEYDAQNISMYDLYEDSITLFRHIERDKPDVVLEQCTGLKDKNGKLIYEGDIIAMSSTDRRQNCFEIFWQEDECQLQAVAYTEAGAYFDNINELLEDHPMKVIGNIHENPELLEEK